MLAVGNLPDPPSVLSVEEWNERQKNGGRHAIPNKMDGLSTPSSYDMTIGEEHKFPQVGKHISDLLGMFNKIPLMAEDDTQDTLYIDCYETATRAEQTEQWRDTETKLREQISRFELEMSRLQLELEKEKQAKEKMALTSQWNQLQDERSRLLDGGLSSLAHGSHKFRSDINNIMENINATAEAAHGTKDDIEVNSNIDITIEGLTGIGVLGQTPMTTSTSMSSMVGSLPPTSPRMKTAMSVGILDVEAIFTHSHSKTVQHATSLPLKAHRNSIRRSSNQLSPREVSPRAGPVSVSSTASLTPTQQIFSSQPNHRAVSQPITSTVNRRPVSGNRMVVCTICKVNYDKDQISLLRGKPFCPRCKERLLEGAKQRGMKI